MRLSLSAVSIALLFSHAGAVLLPEESEEHQEQGNEQDERDLAYRLDPYPNTWIVQLREGSQSAVSQASQVAQNGNGRAGKVFEHALRGFVYYGDDPDTILRDPNVLSVTRDSVAKFTGQIEPSGVKRIFASQKPYMKKATASCRCDAIVAVIDSGVDFYHPDLRVNTAMSVDCTSGFCVKNAGNDNNGHGTHVAGIIGAVGGNNAGVVGVCPGAEIWSIKVLDSNGYGYTSWIIAGIDYVTSWGTKVDVANMSIETKGCYPSYCSAIAKAKAKGVAFAVAAGNSGQSASNYSPACCTNALTVSALADSDGLQGGYGPKTCSGRTDDAIAYYSNYGSSVNIAAPGDCIYSTYFRSGYTSYSGTSMAAPHVAGALAVLASNNHNGNVDTFYSLLRNNGNYYYTDRADGSKEPLLDLRNLPNARMIGSCY